MGESEWRMPLEMLRDAFGMWSASLLQLVAKGIGCILWPRATREVGLSRHLEVETQSSEEVLVVEVVAVVGHSVSQKLVHIGTAVAVVTWSK